MAKWYWDRMTSIYLDGRRYDLALARARAAAYTGPFDAQRQTLMDAAPQIAQHRSQPTDHQPFISLRISEDCRAVVHEGGPSTPHHLLFTSLRTNEDCRAVAFAKAGSSLSPTPFPINDFPIND